MRAIDLALLAWLILTAACKADDPNVVTVYDPYSGDAFPTTRPKVALPASYALVPSSGTDTLSVIDLAANAVVTERPIGRKPVVLDGPHQVVADPAKGVAFVLDAYPDVVAGVGNHSHGSSKRAGWVEVLSLDDFGHVGEVALDPNPGEIALSDDGKRLVVTHYDLAAARTNAPVEQRRSTITLVDPLAIRPFDSPQPDSLLVCAAPHGIALSRPDGATAFVACYGEDAVALVDLVDTHAPVVRVPTGEGTGPYGVALSPNGARLAIGMRDARDVRFLDVATRTVSAIVPVLGETYVPAWSKDGRSVFVPTRGESGVVRIDAEAGTVVRQRLFDVATCVAPIEAIVDRDVVHVVCEGSDTQKGALVTVDATTLDIRGRIELPSYPGRPYVGARP